MVASESTSAERSASHARFARNEELRDCFAPH